MLWKKYTIYELSLEKLLKKLITYEKIIFLVFYCYTEFSSDMKKKDSFTDIV